MLYCNRVFHCILDKDLKTEGFALESCRSMIALMDVSFLINIKLEDKKKFLALRSCYSTLLKIGLLL